MEHRKKQELSKVTIKDLLAKIIEQDRIWWESKDGSNCSSLIKHGNLIPAIHEHFRKLEKEHCCSLAEQNQLQRAQSPVAEHGRSNANMGSACHGNPDDWQTDYNSSDCSSASKNPLADHRITDNDRVHECGTTVSRSRSMPRDVGQARPRTRHVSDETGFGRANTPGRHRHSSVFLHQSSRLNRAHSPLPGFLGSPPVHSSDEKLNIRSSLPPSGIKMPQSSDFDVYRAASACCHYPILARAQFGQDTKSDSDLSENEMRSCQWDGLPSKDCNKSLSQHLLEYLRQIFDLKMKTHQQYQSGMTTVDKRKHAKSKREGLQENLLSQLNLLETDCNPYYAQTKFQSYYRYKSWQDRERKEIIKLLGGRIPRLHGRHRLTTSKRDRCSDYKVLLRKVMEYDLKQNNARTEVMSMSSGNNSASESSVAAYHGEDRILSRDGQRLLQEFAARYRVAPTTEVCLYLELVEECFREEIGRFDSVATFRTLSHKFDQLQSLIAEGMPLCNSEIDILFNVIDAFIERTKRLVMTLMTEWTPTTDQLKSGLELAQRCFYMRKTLTEEEDSQWPGCLSKWFEASIIDNYHSCKKPDYCATTWTVLLSVSHAVNVMRAMQKQSEGSLKTDYEAVFGKYITNFPQAVCSGLYEAVISDVRLLAMRPPWIALGSAGKGNRSTERPKDFVELAGIALAYKLAEFEGLINMDGRREETSLNDDEFSWRLYIHHLSMHWIDALSCHLRKLVLRAIALDDFSSLSERIVVSHDEESPRSQMQTQNLPRTSYSQERVRLGSLLRKDSIGNTEEYRRVRGAVGGGLQHVEESSEDAKVSEDVPDAQQSESDSDTLEEDDSTSVQFERVSRPLSSENLADDTDTSCILLSHKKLPNADDYGSPGSYHSCTTTDDSARLHSVQSGSTSNRSFHTPKGDSSSGALKSLNTDSSTCVISSSFSSLPQLIQDVETANLTPPAASTFAPGQRPTLVNGHGLNPAEGDTPRISEDPTTYNVSSSLVDVVCAMTRFVNFIRTIADTVYTLSDQGSCRDGYGGEVFLNPAGFNVKNEALHLRELGERFIQKAVQALCEVIQQYANNMLSIDLPHLPHKAASALVGKKLMRQIINGKYNKTILAYDKTMESHNALNQSDPNIWNDKVARNMMTRLNNLLALQHGMPDLWGYVENLFVPNSPENLSSLISTGTSFPSRHSLSIPSQSSELTASSSEEGHVQDSTRSACTSGSTHTAIYIGNRDNPCGDQNNNEPPEVISGVLVTELIGDVKAETAAKVVREIPDDLCQNKNDDFELEHGDLDGFVTPYMRCVWEYLKERVQSHTTLAVKAMDGLLSYQVREWFGCMLDASLDIPLKREKNQTDAVLRDLDAHLIAVLNNFAEYIHEDGIEKVHEMLWVQIMQDLRVKITEFKNINARLTKPHACHTLEVCTTLIRSWYRHPSQPNKGDLDWLVKPIQPSLTLLELYCLPTTSLVRMYSECEEEVLLNFDLLSTVCHSELSNCKEVMLLCMRDLQDRKTFSGEMLHRTLQHIILAKNPNSDTAPTDALALSQQMLHLDLLEFSFKKKPDNSMRLPDLVPYESMAETSVCHVLEEDRRTFSVSTGSSEYSSLVSEDSYVVSDDSGYLKEFSPQPDYFYKFSQARLPLSLIDNMEQESQSAMRSELGDSFLVKLLRIRSRTDKAAKRFLQEHGHLPRSVLISCFGGCFR